MESMFIAGIAGFLAGGVLMFFMEDKIVAVDQSLHAKIDTLQATTVSAAQQLASHVTQQVSTLKSPAPPQ